MATRHKIVFHDTHAELVEAPLPPVADGQVLIRTCCSLIIPGTERAALVRLWDAPSFARTRLIGSPGMSSSSAANLAVGDRLSTLMNHPD